MSKVIKAIQQNGKSMDNKKISHVIVGTNLFLNIKCEKKYFLQNESWQRKIRDEIYIYIYIYIYHF